MTHIKHKVVIVTGFEKEILVAFNQAKVILDDVFDDPELEEDDREKASNLVSEIVPSLRNGYKTFMIASDGSSEGWIVSMKVSQARDEFIYWLKTNVPSCDYTEVVFGGDDDKKYIY